MAAVVLAANAFDKGLHIQMETKDDASYAVWAAVGLETVTLSAVLMAEPGAAFTGSAVPSASELAALDFRTKPFSALAEAAAAHYTSVPFPAVALSFMTEVRNKLLHAGGTAHAGLVGPTTRMVRDVSRWLYTFALPKGPFPGTTHVLEIDRIEELPGSLEAAAGKIAANNADHLIWSLDRGKWDDRPDLRAIALRELDECRTLF